MKIKLLIFHSLILCANVYAQDVNKPAQYESNQVWASGQFSDFINNHHINTNISASIDQVREALKKACSMDCSSVLSVSGLELEGKRLNHSEIELEFVTYAEINNKGFIIQRSLDSRSSDFDSVGFVWGKGNAASASSYKFTDQNSFRGYSYYRLKQMDIDGKSTYSKIIKVDGYAKALAVQVLPNPVTTENFRVKFLGFTGMKNNQITIMDAKGRLMKRLTGLDIRFGEYDLNAGRLAPGWYFLQVSNTTEKANTTFIVR